MADRDEEKGPFVRIGFFGTMGQIDPMEVWSDPTGPDQDNAVELMILLQESREMNEQGVCSIPGMPSVEQVKEQPSL